MVNLSTIVDTKWERVDKFWFRLILWNFIYYINIDVLTPSEGLLRLSKKSKISKYSKNMILQFIVNKQLKFWKFWEIFQIRGFSTVSLAIFLHIKLFCCCHRLETVVVGRITLTKPDNTKYKCAQKCQYGAGFRMY